MVICPAPFEPTTAETSAISRLGSDLGRSTVALKALNGSMVRLVLDDGRASWKFKHPTIGDAFAALLLEDPELMGIYLQAAPVDELIHQVTCGDVGLEQAVILPKVLFPVVRQRLSALSGHRYMRIAFLARRCDRDFLSEYLSANPSLPVVISNPYLPLDGDPAVDPL